MATRLVKEFAVVVVVAVSGFLCGRSMYEDRVVVIQASPLIEISLCAGAVALAAVFAFVRVGKPAAANVALWIAGFLVALAAR